VAHSKVQRRGDKSAPREETLIFREGWGMRQVIEDAMNAAGRDRRLDLGLQDAPRSTTYTNDQTNAQKGRIVRWHQETVHK